MRDDVKLIMSKRNEEINSKFYQLFCRVTVVFLLASISIGCYFAAKDLKLEKEGGPRLKSLKL